MFFVLALGHVMVVAFGVDTYLFEMGSKNTWFMVGNSLGQPIFFKMPKIPLDINSRILLFVQCYFFFCKIFITQCNLLSLRAFICLMFHTGAPILFFSRLILRIDKLFVACVAYSKINFLSDCYFPKSYYLLIIWKIFIEK